MGITKNPEKRFATHLKESRKNRNKNHRFYNSLKKYDDFIFKVLVVSNRDYCLDLENKLRPSSNIGLNHAMGGKYTVCSKDVSKSTREKLAISASNAYANDPTLAERCGGRNKGSKRTEDQKKRLSESLKGKGKAWLNSIANHTVWMQAFGMYEFYNSSECKNYCDLSRNFGLQKTVTKTIYAYFENGWNPLEDEQYLNYYKENKNAHDSQLW